MILSEKELPYRSDFAAWLQQRQGWLQVTKTTITPSGQIIDWIPIESQCLEVIATPPPTGPSSSATVADEKRPTRGATLEIVESGLAGHVPILRPNFSKVPDTTSLERFLSKRGGLKFDVRRRQFQPTDPNPAGYFHATSAETIINYGCEAWYNVWDPQINIPSSPGDDHSISQTWLQNYDKPQLQSLEAGLTVDQSLNGDTAPHLFTFYTTNGYGPGGDNVGGYNRLVKGWVQVHPTIYPGIRITGISTLGASPQVEIALKYQLRNDGNWWLGFNNDVSGPWIWLGYYPASLFAGGLGGHASWASFGGEVYSALPNPCQTTDQMGSGLHAWAGFSNAAYQRNLRTQSNLAGTLVDFAGSPETDSAASTCPPGLYTIQCFMNSGGSWGSYQYFGGQADSAVFGRRVLEVATTFANETDGTWLMADWSNPGGKPDLVFIKTNNTPNGHVEVHIASAASNYQTQVLETATTFANETDGTWLMANWSNPGGKPDLVFIKTNNTPSGHVEVHIASAASNYQTQVLETATTFANETDGTWLMANWSNPGGKPDLVFIKTNNTPSGHVEVHIASAASNYQTQVLETATTFANETDGTWLMVDWSNPGGKPDLVFIKTGNTPSGHVEVHIASAASNYQTRVLETATTFANETDGTWLMADWSNPGGKPDLVFIKTNNTPSGHVEVHIAAAASMP